MIYSQLAYDNMEDINKIVYISDCRAKDAMRELRIEFYNKLGKYVDERILMEVGNSLLQDWKSDEDNVISISEKLNIEDEHWRALDYDLEWIKEFLVAKSYHKDDDAYDLDW
jgi:hypothetical protein